MNDVHENYVTGASVTYVSARARKLVFLVNIEYDNYGSKNEFQ